jgi:ABC-type multidrug transport system permease subunit
MVPGLIAVSSMNQAYSISFDIHIARLYTMTYQGLLVAPIERWEILVGELLFAITKSLSPLIFFVVYLSFFPSLGLVLNIPFFISWLIHVLTWALIGVVIAFKIDSHADHATFTTFVVTPITFISDTFFPVSRLGGFFELIANFSPLTHTTRMIRYSMQSGFGLPFIIELGYSLIVLLIFAIFGIIVLSRAER